MLNMKNEDVPIDLYDDGLRLDQAGETKCGRYPFVAFYNPELVAESLAQRSLKAQIKLQNERRFA